MKKTAIIIMLLTIFTKIIGFSRELVLSYFYGASITSDAYLIALTIPQSIFTFIGVGIGTGYIPIFNDIEKSKGLRESETFTNNVVNVLMVLSTLVVMVSFYFAGPLVKLFASGLSGDGLELAIKFTKISIFAVYFSSLTYIFSARLQILEDFHSAVLMGIPLNVIIVLSIVFSFYNNSIYLAYGFVLASFSQAIYLYYKLRKKSFKYQPIINIKDENLKKIIYLAIPVILGVSVNQINVLVDRTIASRIVVGGITALNYANRLNIFIQAVFVMSIATIFYPTITKLVTDGKLNQLKKILHESINVILITVLPITIGTIIFSKEIVSVLFARGAFDSKAIELTSDALLFYSIGTIGYGLREILSRVFYAMQDTKTPTLNATIGMVINIVLNIVLSKYMGIGGLALATSIAAILTTVLLFFSLRKKIGQIGMKSIFVSFFKILCASILMGLISKMGYIHLSNRLSETVALFTAIIMGIVSYFVILYFLKIDDVDVVYDFIKKKLKKK